MMFFDPELFSVVAASFKNSTLREHSHTAYWNPPQVPRKGQSRVRANSIPLSIPCMLRYGLPGDAHRPSKLSSVLRASASTSDGVGSHSDSTFNLSFAAACCRASLVA